MQIHRLLLFRNILLVSLAAAFTSKVDAQFGSNPISQALDTTALDCQVSEFGVANDTFTKGGSSVRSLNNRTLGRSSQVFCSTVGDITLTFDWRLTKGQSDDRFEAEAQVSGGNIVSLARLTQTTDWVTEQVYLPAGTTFVGFGFFNFDNTGAAWVDNIRVEAGNTIPPAPAPPLPPSDFPNNPLSVALDNIDLDFITNGDAEFFVQFEEKSNGPSAVQAGDITDNQTTFLFTLVSGGPRLRFDWKVSSESRFDGLIFFFLDQEGNIIDEPISITGEVDWQTVDTKIPGEQDLFLVWAYTKDSIISAGRDTGWIDNVVVGATKREKLITAIISILL